LRTLSAGGSPGDHDTVAGSNRRHVAPDFLHDPGTLVAEQDREPVAPTSRLDNVEVGVAEPTREHPDENLALAEWVDGEFLDRRRCVWRRVNDAPRHGFVTVPGTVS
jgi:hypothetical protein